MKRVTRTGDPGQNFVEETEDSAHSIELSWNAKGKIQHTIKLYFSDGKGGDAVLKVKELDQAIRRAFPGQMAGEEIRDTFPQKEAK